MRFFLENKFNSLKNVFSCDKGLSQLFFDRQEITGRVVKKAVLSLLREYASLKDTSDVH